MAKSNNRPRYPRAAEEARKSHVWLNCSSRHRVVSCFHDLQPFALGLNGVVSVEHDVPEVRARGCSRLAPRWSRRGVYNRLWHSTSQSPPVHWVYTGSHFLRFLRFL